MKDIKCRHAENIRIDPSSFEEILHQIKMRNLISK